MISLKLLILVKSLPFLVFLTIFLSNQIVSASKSHLEHYKYKHSSSDLIKNKYIIEFSIGHDSGLSGTFFDSFRQDFSNVNIKSLHNYKSPIFHGLAFHIDAPDSGAYSDVMNAMMDHPDVENVYPQARMVRSSRNFGKSGINLAIDPTDLVSPHQMTQVKRVHEELKNKGKGIFIGIIDSGIDYNHPALGGGFGKDYKVAAGYDLVGDHYDPDGHKNPLEDEDPYDSCPDISGGHGTHVAGIIGGYDPSQNFTGVAPDATLGMWRVFSCVKSTTNSQVILAALIRAYEAGVDVISISIGGASSWTSDATNTAFNNIIEQGVVVVIAAGNNGADPMYTLSDPSRAEDSISVASVENDFYYGPNFKASGIDYFIPYSLANGSTDHFPHASIPMVVQKYHQAPSNTPSDCSEKNIYFSQDNIKDSLVFLQNQCVDLVSKIAKENGALGLIVMSRDNLRTGSFKKSNGTLTSFAVSKDYGLDLYRKFNEKGNVRIKLRNHQSKSYLNQNLAGGTISNFTSVGPSAELLFKPEIGGIGGAVLSTLPLKIGGWGVYQGTSMATPYVSGSIALYLAVHGKKAKENPAFIKKKFMNYAKPVQVYKSHSLDSPLRQGAGLVQVYDAITQTALVSPSKISFNDTATDLYKTHVLTVSNWGSEDVTYYTYNNVSVALTSFDPCNNESYYGAPNLTEKGATITFSSDIITVPSQKTANVTVTVDLSDSSLSSFVYYGGFIQFKSKNNQYKDIHVPYFGVNGRQKDLPVLSPALPPFLNDTATNTTFINTDKKVFKFDSYGNSSIEINFSLVTPTNFIKCEIIDAHNDVLGYIPLSNDKVNLDLMTRNINSLPYYTFDVDSYYVPPEYLIDNNALSKIRYHGLGRYRLSALKLFGNPEIEEDWEVWNSSTVNFV